MGKLIIDIVTFIFTLPIRVFNFLKIFILKRMPSYNKLYTGKIVEVYDNYGMSVYIIENERGKYFLYHLSEAIKFETPSCFRKLYKGETVRFKKGYKKNFNGKKYNIISYISPISSIEKISGYIVNATKEENKDHEVKLSVLAKIDGNDTIINKTINKNYKSSNIQFGSYCELFKKENTNEIVDIIVYGLVDIKKTTKSNSSNIKKNGLKSPTDKIKSNITQRLLGFLNRVYMAIFPKNADIIATVKSVYENGDILFITDDGKEYIYSSTFALLSSLIYTNYTAYPNARVKIFKTSPFSIDNKKIALYYSMVANDNHTFKDIFNYDYISQSFFEEHGIVSKTDNDYITVTFQSNHKTLSYDIPTDIVEKDKEKIDKNDECFVVINKLTNEPIYCSILKKNELNLPDLQNFVKTKTNLSVQ